MANMSFIHELALSNAHLAHLITASVVCMLGRLQHKGSMYPGLQRDCLSLGTPASLLTGMQSAWCCSAAMDSI